MRDALRIARLIDRQGACQFCVHRVEGFGVFACTIPGRTFPICLDKPVTRFAPDYAKIARHQADMGNANGNTALARATVPRTKRKR